MSLFMSIEEVLSDESLSTSSNVAAQDLLRIVIELMAMKMLSSGIALATIRVDAWIAT